MRLLIGKSYISASIRDSIINISINRNNDKNRNENTIRNAGCNRDRSSIRTRNMTTNSNRHYW